MWIESYDCDIFGDYSISRNICNVYNVIIKMFISLLCAHINRFDSSISCHCLSLRSVAHCPQYSSLTSTVINIIFSLMLIFHSYSAHCFERLSIWLLLTTTRVISLLCHPRYHCLCLVVHILAVVVVHVMRRWLIWILLRLHSQPRNMTWPWLLHHLLFSSTGELLMLELVRINIVEVPILESIWSI